MFILVYQRFIFDLFALCRELYGTPKECLEMYEARGKMSMNSDCFLS
jgi:hypothetical protein